MAPKQGDIRVQKRGVIYGPMTRETIDRLLANDKVASSDLVSVRGGEWIEIATFLLSPADDAGEDATLRLLAGQRVFNSLSRRGVEQLRSAGRVDDDDLICALNGPWMRLGDFFAPPTALPPGSPDAPSPVRGRAVHDQTVRTVDTPPSPPVAALPMPVPAAPSVVQTIEEVPSPKSQAPLADASTPLRVMSGVGASYYSMPPALPPGIRLSDVWFVRIRGMHSAPLKKHHLRTLFEAHELTADSPARNDNWPDNAWSPVCLIPELADVLR